MSTDLRIKLAEELHAIRCGCEAPDAQSLYDAETALDVFAEWLRSEADQARSRGALTQADALDARADRLTAKEGTNR